MLRRASCLLVLHLSFAKAKGFQATLQQLCIGLYRSLRSTQKRLWWDAAHLLLTYLFLEGMGLYNTGRGVATPHHQRLLWRLFVLTWRICLVVGGLQLSASHPFFQTCLFECFWYKFQIPFTYIWSDNIAICNTFSIINFLKIKPFSTGAKFGTRFWVW